jgi:hypothetical protein
MTHEKPLTVAERVALYLKALTGLATEERQEFMRLFLASSGRTAPHMGQLSPKRLTG